MNDAVLAERPAAEFFELKPQLDTLSSWAFLWKDRMSMNKKLVVVAMLVGVFLAVATITHFFGAQLGLMQGSPDLVFDDVEWFSDDVATAPIEFGLVLPDELKFFQRYKSSDDRCLLYFEFEDGYQLWHSFIKSGIAWKRHGLSKSIEADNSIDLWRYQDGKLHGTQLCYHPSGKIRIERNYQDGKLHGTDKGWDADGNPTYSCVNQFGVEVSSATY